MGVEETNELSRDNKGVQGLRNSCSRSGAESPPLLHMNAAAIRGYCKHCRQLFIHISVTSPRTRER